MISGFVGECKARNPRLGLASIAYICGYNRLLERPKMISGRAG